MTSTSASGLSVWLARVAAFALTVVLTYAVLKALIPRSPTANATERANAAPAPSRQVPTKSIEAPAPAPTPVSLESAPPWPLPTLEMNFEQAAPWMDALRARADAGDRQARAAVLRAQIPCMLAPPLSDEEIDRRSNAYLHQEDWPRMPPELIAEDKRFAEQNRARLHLERDRCQALAPIDRGRFLEQLTEVLATIDVDWFDAAFDGNIAGNDPFSTVRHAERLIPLRAAYRAQLERRIDAGDADAMTRLANALRKDYVLGPDPALADAYEYAVSLLPPYTTPIEPANEQARVLGTEIAQRFRRH
jgi:hypothetical protein